MMPRCLPDPVPPAQNELVVSYVTRLATLHGINVNTLWTRATVREASGGVRRQVVPEYLAALTGRTPSELAGALPELHGKPFGLDCYRPKPQAGCHRCDAKHPGGRITRLLPHHTYVCLRHRTWIGPPDVDRPAADLANLPAIVHAQRRHHRLIHRHGWQNTYDAVLTGFLICGHFWDGQPGPADHHHIWHTWTARADQMIPHEHTQREFSTSRLFACIYPEAVNIAALIASPYWREQASGTPSQRSRFFSEIGARITYRRTDIDGHQDAIAHWADTDAWRHPAEPNRRHHPGRASTLLVNNSDSSRPYSRSRTWFAADRRAGKPILWHSHIKPVLVRPWSPEFRTLDQAIWNSAATHPELLEATARQRAEHARAPTTTTVVPLGRRAPRSARSN
jgi:hypothetical protein